MTIRKWKLGVAAVLVAAVMAGCTDPTVVPKSTVTTANIFTDPGSYRAFLARIYAGLIVTGQQGPAGNPDIQGIDEGFSEYLRLYWYLQEVPTDEAVIGWNDPGLPTLNTDTWGPSNNMVNAMYYRIYFQIMLANEFLRQTVDDSLAARGQSDLMTEVHQYRAEARFLRALSYWHGIDLFGNIPLVTEDDPLGATPPKQSTRVDIFNYVISELKAIKGDLPAPGPNSYGRATPQAANMLLAELYLNAGVYTGTPDWADALAYADSVISSGDYSLNPVFRDNFTADNNLSPEIIFAAPQDGNHTQTWGGMTFLVHAGCGGNMSAADYGMDYCWGGYRLKQQVYNLFTAGDSRSAFFWTSGQTVDVDSIGDFQYGTAAPKFTNKNSDGTDAAQLTMISTDFPIFRLGEAYLIYAEAAVRNNSNLGQALTYVNDLRERAFGDATHDITAAQLTLPFILNARARELLFEARRRTDLIRFGMFSGGSYLWAWKGGVQGGQAIPQTMDLYPLPANEIIANPNLTQNPGY
jgi:starch-binding outer membrane protein, SusD/RagB family